MQAPLDSAQALIAAMFAAHQQQASATVIELGLQARQQGLACEASELLLAIAQQAAGRLDDAIASFQGMVQTWPRVASYWNNLGVVQRQAGRFEAAQAAFAQALQLQPDDWELHYNLGLLYREQCQALLAREHLLQASAMVPEQVEVRIQAAHACYLCGDTGAQARLLLPAAQWPPLPPDSALLVASMLGSEGRLEVALEVLDRAASLLAEQAHSSRLRLQIQRAALLERSNAASAAGQLLLQIRATSAELSAAPEWGHELAQLEAAMASRRHDYQAALGHYQHAAEQARDDANYAAIHFGMARAHDRLGQVDAALVEAERAHAAQFKQAVQLVPELLLPDCEPLLLSRARVSPAQYRQWSSAPAPTRPSPVFIIGFPRSGTTLLEQMLDALPDYQSMDERPFIHELTVRMEGAGQAYPADLGQLSDTDIEQLRAVYWGLVDRRIQIPAQTRLVDKNPLNMLALPMISRLFPDARIIMCLRHPMDVLLSCYLQTFRSPAFMLMCADMQRLATTYRHAFEHWFEQTGVLAPRQLLWRYETVVNDFPGQSRALAEFLQIKDPAPMAEFASHAHRKGFISTPSYAQVTEGIYQRGVGRWQAYRRLFEPVLGELEPVLQRLGYSL